MSLNSLSHLQVRSLGQAKRRWCAAPATLIVATIGLGALAPAAAQTAPGVAPLPSRTPLLANGRRSPAVSRRRETVPPRAPESSQGQVTNANINAPTAGVFPFVPPYFTTLPGGGTFSVDTKGISANTDDKSVQFRIGGRYQQDFSAASVRPRLPGRLLVDDTDSRRAFFESYLTLNNGVSFAFQYDFANATQPIQDAVVSYHPLNSPVILTLGNFKEPFSLNQLISDNNTTFTERSIMDGLVPARNFGGVIGTYGDKWTAAGGVFGGNANLGPDINGVAGTARVTYAPILEKEQLLHFGLAGSYRSLDATGQALSFSARPEDSLERVLVSTGTLANADAVGRVNVEALYQVGPYRLQGEFTYADVQGRNGQAGRSFEGGYIEGAWVVNGAGRPYRIAAPYGSEFAVLQGVQVEDAQRVSRGGIGVFELAARYSAVDLRAPGVRGGALQDVTAGLNWYPDRNIRMMADYVHGFAEPAAFSVAGGRNVDSDAFVGRIQLYW